ncbi:hypothetical protein I4U23_015724 [Adineta vaga]|nr:hypothetical protein I4U23_015724 [Adineta vaga]
MKTTAPLSKLLTIQVKQLSPSTTVQWLLNGNLNDFYSRYNGCYNVYVSAICFPPDNYMTSNSYLNLTSISFTISAWIWSLNNWCIPMIGFDISGCLSIQTLNSNGILPLYHWNHISMTYSIFNGIQLFINGLLTNRNDTFRSYLASGQMNTIILGTDLCPNISIINQTRIVPALFHGKN